MKKLTYFIIVLSVFILAITFLSATKVMAQDYPEGMISYWKFEEGNGDIAHDSVNGHDGTLNGNPQWTTGIVGGALSFDGAGDVVKIPYSNDWNTGNELTVEAWINLDRHTYWGAIVSRDGYACGGHPWYMGWVLEIYYSQLPTKITFRVASGVDPNVIQTYAPIPPSPDIIYGEWYHAVGVDDGSSIRLYINGQEVGSGTSRSDPVNPSDQYGITIGSDTGCWGFDLDGKIDEVAIYNRALTPAEIQQHYQNGLEGKGYEETPLQFSDFINEMTKVEYKLGRDGGIENKLEIKWYFKLDEENDGFDLLAEDVEFTVGDINLTIPAGSFQFDGEYELTDTCAVFADLYTPDTCDEKKAKGKIKEENEYYVFDVKIDKCELPEVGTVNPLHIELLIGDDKGETDLYLLVDHGKVEFKGAKP